MRICLVGRGESVHMRRWAGWFSRAGHEVHLIARTSEPLTGIVQHLITVEDDRRPRWQRYPELTFNLWLAQWARAFRTLRLVLASVRPDVVHVHGLYFPADVAAWHPFRPLVFTPWDGELVWQIKPVSFWYRQTVRRAVRRADLVTVDSAELRERCLRYGRPASRTAVLQWGVELDTFRPDVDTGDLSRELGIGARDPVVLSTRSVAPMYNIGTLIRATPEVLRALPDVKFVFAWPVAPELEEMRRVAAELAVLPSVRFVGVLESRDRLAQLYARADVFVSLASHDTTPVSLLEAMACGTFPVVSDLPSIREWVTDGDNGFLVNVEDSRAIGAAVVRALADHGLRAAAARRNGGIVRQRADHNENMARMERLYQLLVEGEVPECEDTR